MYDYCIVGAGPAGLTAALLLSPSNRVLLIDAAPDIGGCHRSIWADSPHGPLYHEHGPKVYSSRYYTLIEMIAVINSRLPAARLDFGQLFTHYSGLARVIARIFRQFSAADLAKFGAISLSADGETAVDAAFSTLSTPARTAIDKICRLSDGAPAATTRMDKFRSLIRIVETLYTAAVPLGDSLFYYWKLALVQSGVRIHLGTKVEGVRYGPTHIIHTSDGEFAAKRVVFAIPPQSAAQFLPKIFPNSYISSHSYSKYICVTLHWVDKNTVIPEPPETKWGIVTSILPPTFTPTTVAVQCAVSITDIPGSSGRTATASTRREIVDEIIAQTTLPPPSYAVFPPDFPAFVDGLVNVPIPYQVGDRVYTVGTHNLTSSTPFTTFESAAESAKKFVEFVLKN